MANIYTDTNVLRYFVTTFAETSLPDDIGDQMVLASLTLLELASQLGTGGAEEAFAALRILRRSHGAQNAGMWLLPWPSDLFRALFNLPTDKNTIAPTLTNLVLNIWNAAKAEDLNDEGKEARAMWDSLKDKLADDFATAVDASGSEEPKKALRREIADLAHVGEINMSDDLLVQSFNAYYVFKNHLIHAALQDHKYKCNFKRRSNDLIDALSLFYLADPRLHLLTSDTGFRHVEGSSQANRVHRAVPACIKDPECATRKLRDILEAAVAAA